VTLADSRTLTAIEHRERPHGYLVLREGRGGRRTPGAERSAGGAWSRRHAGSPSRHIDVEAGWAPVSRRRSESINPDQSMRVAIRPATIDVPAGALFVPMNQAGGGHRGRGAGARLARQLPRGSGSFPMDDGRGSEAPVYRVMTDLPVLRARGLALCWEPRHSKWRIFVDHKAHERHWSGAALPAMT